MQSRIIMLKALGFTVKDVQVRPSGEALPWLETKCEYQIKNEWGPELDCLHPESADGLCQGNPCPLWKLKKKGKGFHIWWHVESQHPLSDLERLRLQFLLGDDPGRCWINYLRITKRHSPLWNKIFGYITWRSPQDPHCKQCRLLILLEELKEGEKNGEKTGEKRP